MIYVDRAVNIYSKIALLMYIMTIIFKTIENKQHIIVKMSKLGVFLRVWACSSIVNVYSR